jgi:hypothetical protein
MSDRATSRAKLRRTRAQTTSLALCALLVSACGGSGGGGAADAPVGTFRAKPDGGHYFVDEHRGGGAPRLGLVEITWGRLVDVHALGSDGQVQVEPVLRDFVIGEDVLDVLGDYQLDTNPITQETRLVVQRVLGAPDDGTGTFEELVRRAGQRLAAVLPKAPDASGAVPFSFVARNGCLVLRFDDLLDDGEAALQALADDVRLLGGYPPTVPRPARIVFDPNHGGIAGGRFHSTRVLVDPTVSESEAADSPVPLVLESLGFPSSEGGSQAANVQLRMPTAVDPGSGQFTLLRNVSGGALDAERSAPFDPTRATRDLVRALRAGNSADPNNGFLLDLVPPHVVGAWPCTSLAARPLDPGGFAWELELRFDTVCASRPVPGDIVGIGERFLEVGALAEVPSPGMFLVRARALDARAPQASELLGNAEFQTIYRSGLEVERGCWVRFSPAPGVRPSTDVDASAITIVRFSEPMDPATAQPFDKLLTVRGFESAPVTSDTLVVGQLHPSLDLRELVFTPSLPYAHSGESAAYSLRIRGAGGVTDLAGNELAAELPALEYSIDPRSPPARNRSFVLRFDSPDELEPLGAPDLRGQFTYQLERGTIQPREVAYGSRAVDRSNPMLSVMPAFSPGVVTPLSPLGSRLQTVWRYADLGWSIRDETKYNLDVIGLSWSPARTAVNADFFEQFEVRLAHSNKLPDEQPRSPISGGMRYPLSGLWDGPIPFDDNVLVDPDSPQKVMHPRARGYRVDPRDLYFSPLGTPLMPWPLNRAGGELVSFTWRDTAAIAVGGDYGVGVPLDSEVGAPLFLENAIGSFAPAGRVPTVGLPLLMEFRCYPSETGIGLNPLAIHLASNASPAPNFRAYSTGGFDSFGQRVLKDPDLEVAPTGGFNPGSRPPGRPTVRSADNSIYLGQLDYVVRLSRAHTIWIDTGALDPRYAEVVIEPAPAARPPGTDIVLDYRGADGFLEADTRPFDASALTPYGDPRAGTILFHAGDPTWKRDIRAVDGARFVQVRITFVNNVFAGLVTELSAIGVAYELE